MRSSEEAPAPWLRVVEGALLAIALWTLTRPGLNALDLGLLLLPAHLHRVVALRSEGLLVRSPSLGYALVEAGVLAALLLSMPVHATVGALVLALLYALHPGDGARVFPMATAWFRDGFFLLLAGYGAVQVSTLDAPWEGALASIAFLLVAFEALDTERDPSFRASLRRTAACGLLFWLPVAGSAIRLALSALLILGPAASILRRRYGPARGGLDVTGNLVSAEKTH